MSCSKLQAETWFVQKWSGVTLWWKQNFRPAVVEDLVRSAGRDEQTLHQRNLQALTHPCWVGAPGTRCRPAYDHRQTNVIKLRRSMQIVKQIMHMRNCWWTDDLSVWPYCLRPRHNGKPKICRVPRSLLSVKNQALGKDILCRVPHSAKNCTRQRILCRVPGTRQRTSSLPSVRLSAKERHSA